MSDKILWLELIYKGKVHSYVSSGKDFKNSYFIGSDEYLFWQILDRSFPKKFKLIEKKGSAYVMNLRKGMELTVMKGDVTLSPQDLKGKKMLQGNSLILNDTATTGIIKFSGDWEIHYFFKKPYHVVYTHTEKLLIQQYSKHEGLSPENKVTFAFMTIAFILLGITTVVMKQNYEPPQVVNSFKEKLAQKQAHLMQMKQEVVEEEVVPEEEVASNTGFKKKAETEEEAAQQVEEAEKNLEKGMKDIFGSAMDDIQQNAGNINDNSVDMSQMFKVTTSSSIVTTAKGANLRKTKSKVDIAKQFSEKGGDSGLDGSTGLDEILAGQSVSGGEGYKVLSSDEVGNGAEDIGYVSIKSTAELASIKGRFAGLKTLGVEGVGIQEMSAEEKTASARIEKVVDAYKRRLNRLFRNESRIAEMYGTIRFVLYINKDTNLVEMVEIFPEKGGFFTPEFLQKAEQQILTWRIRVDQNRRYETRMKFLKQ